MIWNFQKNQFNVIIRFRHINSSEVWGYEDRTNSDKLDNYINFLRRRLQIVESRIVLKADPQKGYCLDMPNNDKSLIF